MNLSMVNGNFVFLVIASLLFLVMLILIRNANKEMELKKIKEKEYNNYKTKTKIEDSDSTRNLIFEQIIKCSLNTKNKKDFFEEYKLPKYILERFKKDYPKYFIDNTIISEGRKLKLIEEALKDFFSVFLIDPSIKQESMFFNFPSLVADDLWHTFLLFTKEYRNFCMNSFGRIIDHEPHTEEEPEKADFSNLLNTYVKLKERNNAKAFKLDETFGIKNKFDYDFMTNIYTEHLKYKAATSSNLRNQSSLKAVDTSLLLSIGLITALEYENINDYINLKKEDLDSYNSTVSTPVVFACGSSSYSATSKASSCGSSTGSSCGSSSSSSCGSASCGGGCGGGG